MNHTSVAQTTWCCRGNRLTAYAVHQGSPINIGKPGVITTSGLAALAQISRKAVTSLACRYEMPDLSGNMKNHRYSAHKVLKSILGIAPKTPRDMKSILILLRKPFPKGVAIPSRSILIDCIGNDEAAH